MGGMYYQLLKTNGFKGPRLEHVRKSNIKLKGWLATINFE